MAEETKDKPQSPQEYWAGYPEAPFSTTFKWIDSNGFEQMTTIRGWAFLPMFETVKKAEAVILENGGNSPAKYQAALHASDTITNQEPVRQPIDDSGNDLPQIFKGRAGRLSVEMKDNKYSFKIEDAQFQAGRKGSKYGVRIWDEVLTAAGLNIQPGNEMPQIGGWAFEYIENDKGYPLKVTRLLKPTH